MSGAGARRPRGGQRAAGSPRSRVSNAISAWASALSGNSRTSSCSCARPRARPAPQERPVQEVHAASARVARHELAKPRCASSAFSASAAHQGWPAARTSARSSCPVSSGSCCRRSASRPQASCSRASSQERTARRASGFDAALKSPARTSRRPKWSSASRPSASSSTPSDVPFQRYASARSGAPRPRSQRRQDAPTRRVGLSARDAGEPPRLAVASRADVDLGDAPPAFAPARIELEPGPERRQRVLGAPRGPRLPACGPASRTARRRAVDGVPRAGPAATVSRRTGARATPGAPARCGRDGPPWD